MIIIKENSNYYKIEVENKEWYPDRIRDLDRLCIPINEEGKETLADILITIETLNIPYKILSFERSNG